MEQSLISQRNYRPKGLDKERILQAVLLLAICVWLLYLINSSHHKQENDDGNLSKLNLTTALGQKGLTQYMIGAKAETRDKDALGELESRENAGEDYESDASIGEDTYQSGLKLEEEETRVLNGKREATEAEFLPKQLYNISVDDNGEDVLRVEAFQDENGIPPDAEESIEPRGAHPKYLDSSTNESSNAIGHKR